MKLKNFTKKKAVATGLAFGVAAGAGGIAAAYFLATGTGTGQAAVGYATPFVITQNTPISGHLYPGTSMTVSFNIENVGNGIQHFTVTGTDVYVPAAGLTIITALQKNNLPVPGCLASWFTTDVTGGASGTLAHGQSDTLHVKVNMTNAPMSQNACQQTIPKLTVAFSGPAGFGLAEAEGGTATWTNNKTTAHLALPANSPAYITTKTAPGAGAFINVLNPPATLPAAAPTFTATNFAAGTPRWVIYFTTGQQHVCGYPGGLWGTGILPTTHTTWTAVKTAAAGKTVTQVQIVLDTSHGSPTTSTITNVTYGTLHF